MVLYDENISVNHVKCSEKHDIWRKIDYFSRILNIEVDDESTIMARLESDLAENTSPGPSPKKSEKEKKLSKKEKKKKRLAKESAENGDEVQSSNKPNSNDGQGY